MTMLSQNSPTLPGRHQRQNSTPVKFSTPNNTSHGIHRRGLSSDQVGAPLQSHVLFPENGISTSVEYFLGQQLTPAANMRETQPQSMRRPGLHQQLMYNPSDDTRALNAMPRLEHGTEVFNHNYHTTPPTEFINEMQHSLQEGYNISTMDAFQIGSTSSAGNLDGFGNGLDDNVGSIQPNEIMNEKVVPPGIMSAPNSRPTSREGAQRPCTPPSQTRMNYFPLTPATTPYSQNANFKKISYRRTAESSPTRKDPNLTIKASHEMQRGLSCQDNFTAMREHAMSPDVPSPPNTAPLELVNSIDLTPFPQPNFLNMSALNLDMPPWEGGYNASNYSPMSNAVSSTLSSFQSSPEITQMSLFEARNGDTNTQIQISDLPKPSASQSTTDLESSSSPAAQELHPRSQSMSQVDDFSECIEETGVTVDEIASFIHSEGDNIWSCLFTDCGKRFSRKENIKAHVQTHLGDRQYRCRDCDKRFVRQHDLKRHANIHSGERRYRCPCNKPFARHDALTRHRQRGMCVGAYEGTPKKITKRGRPKKTRPDPQERMEKSAATRQRALENLERRSPGKLYASSVSGSSSSAYPSPDHFGSPPEQADSPPELDISSSSPAAAVAIDFEPNLSPVLPSAFDSGDHLFEDYDWTAGVEKNETSKEMTDAMFDQYFSEEFGGALNDF